jgi:hypothetical protein
VSDTVSEETSIFDQRTFRLSLSKDPKEWAAVILKSLTLGSLTCEESLNILAQTSFCIRKSVALLEQVYSGIGERGLGSSPNVEQLRCKPSDKRKFVGPTVE